MAAKCESNLIDSIIVKVEKGSKKDFSRKKSVVGK